MPTTDQALAQLLDSVSNGGTAQNGDLVKLLVLNYLQSQQNQNRSMDLATAPRTDANGNKVSYDPVKGWVIDTTPTTKSILEAQQLEQQRSLTEDAPRNRQAAERADSRSRTANDAFTKAFGQATYAPKMSEADYIGDAQKHAAWAQKDQAHSAAGMAATAALRGGHQADFTKVFQAANAAPSGNVLGEGIDKGRQQFQQFGNQAANNARKAAEFAASIAGSTTNSQIANPSVGQELAGAEGQSLTALLQTLNSGSQTSSQLLNQIYAALKSQG